MTTTTTSEIVVVDGYQYILSSSQAAAYDESKKSFLAAIDKIAAIGDAMDITVDITIKGLDEDDIELALDLLRASYQRIADMERGVMNHIISICDDVADS